MHYSIIPYEVAFAPQPSDEKVMPYMTTTYQGVTMDVSRGEDGTCTIERIYSTNPKDFLNRKFQIGQKIVIPQQ